MNNETFSTITESGAITSTLTNEPKTNDKGMAVKKKIRKPNIRRNDEHLSNNNPEKQINPWLWTIIAITLGVSPQSREDPGIFSTVLQIFTIGSAMSKYLHFRSYLFSILNRSDA